MQISEYELENNTVISVAGDVDLYCAGELKEAVAQHWKKQRDSLILDMADVEYLDSSGIGAIINLYSSAQRQDLDFCLASVKPAIYKVMELTKLIGFIPMANTVNEASARFLGSKKERLKKGLNPGPLLVNGKHALFETNGMRYKDFNIDFRRIRYLSNLLSSQAPESIRDGHLLEQQVSEIVKNAVRHGNENDIRKKVKIWFLFDENRARLIVEDEGPGFKKLEDWNAFYRKRNECFEMQDFESMAEYISYRTEKSREDDGGNALFAAVEYWNEGVVYNESRNAVAVGRWFR